jgi:signal peptidase I
MQTNSSPLHLLRYAHALLSGVCIFLVFLIVVNSFAFTFYRVDGHSMDPTLHDGQILGVNLLSNASNLKIGDVIIASYQGNLKTRFVKRVTAIGGDTVNHQGIDIVLKPDELYIIGDNQDHSTDSRTYGPIKSTQVIGKLIGNF